MQQHSKSKPFYAAWLLAGLFIATTSLQTALTPPAMGAFWGRSQSSSEKEAEEQIRSQQNACEDACKQQAEQAAEGLKAQSQDDDDAGASAKASRGSFRDGLAPGNQLLDESGRVVRISDKGCVRTNSLAPISLAPAAQPGATLTDQQMAMDALTLRPEALAAAPTSEATAWLVMPQRDVPTVAQGPQAEQLATYEAQQQQQQTSPAETRDATDSGRPQEACPPASGRGRQPQSQSWGGRFQQGVSQTWDTINPVALWGRVSPWQSKARQAQQPDDADASQPVSDSDSGMRAARCLPQYRGANDAHDTTE
jgi:hypothetical protein